MEPCSPKLKKLLIFQEGIYKTWKAKISFTFSYKEAKIFKLQF